MSESPHVEVTALLRQATTGDERALAEVMPVLYGELKRLAGHYFRAERCGHTLQPTAIVHEAFIRLVAQKRVDWQSRDHFVAVAAQAMRRILVDHARQRLASKRGGVPIHIDNDSRFDLEAPSADPADVLALDEAITRLQSLNGQQARVVELRYFSNLTVEETAHVLHVSGRTVKRDWAMAKAWLRIQLAERRI